MALNKPSSTVLFMGMEQSGKTTLIHKFLRKDTKTEPRASIALEYTYGRKEDASNAPVVNIWELAHGRKMHPLLDDLITPENVYRITCVIVLDLTKPALLIQMLKFFLNKIQVLTNRVYKFMKQKGSEDGSKLILRSKKRFGENHPEINKITFTGIPLIIIGSKFDKFLKVTDPAKVKAMNSVLRSVAHLNGASVLYSMKNQYDVGNSNGDSMNLGDEVERQDKFFRMILNHHAFGSALPNLPVQQDYLKPVRVTAGKDSLEQICKLSNNDPEALSTKYESIFADSFGPQSSCGDEDREEDEKFLKLLREYAEPSVDAVRLSKMSSLQNTIPGGRSVSNASNPTAKTTLSSRPNSASLSSKTNTAAQGSAKKSTTGSSSTIQNTNVASTKRVL